MTRLVLIALAMFATATLAADPTSGRVAKKIAPKNEHRPNTYLRAAAEAERREQRRIADVIELMSSTRPQLEAFVLRYQGTNTRMSSLLHESDGMTTADFARLRKNMQPSVLTYERLKGAIGP